MKTNIVIYLQNYWSDFYVVFSDEFKFNWYMVLDRYFADYQVLQ